MFFSIFIRPPNHLIFYAYYALYSGSAHPVNTYPAFNGEFALLKSKDTDPVASRVVDFNV